MIPTLSRTQPSDIVMPKKVPLNRNAPMVYPTVVDDHPMPEKRKGVPTYDADLMVRPLGSIAGRTLQTDRVMWSVDVETTGLNHYSDRIVQLAAIPYYPNGTRGPARVWFFNPTIPVSPEAEAIHHLSNEKLSAYATFDERAAEIWQVLKDSDLLGYNIKAFDVRMIANAFHRAGYAFPLPETRVVDALRIFRSNVTRDSAGGNHKLNTAHKFYCDTDIRDAHDAEADAQATLDVLLRQVAVHREVPATVADLHTYTQETRPFARADTYARAPAPSWPTLRPYIRAPRRISPDPTSPLGPRTPPALCAAQAEGAWRDAP